MEEYTLKGAQYPDLPNKFADFKLADNVRKLQGLTMVVQVQRI